MGYFLVADAALLGKGLALRDRIHAAGRLTGLAPDVVQLGDWAIVVLDPEHMDLVSEFIAVGFSLENG